MKEVAAVAVIKDGKLLMGKRKDNGKWTNPGGHLEKGEDPQIGAAREVKEEAGIEVAPDNLRHLESRVIKKPNGKKLKIHAFKVVLTHAPTSMKEDPDDEVHRWHWVSITPPLNKDIFDNLHVPMEDNLIITNLGVTMEKNAFYLGFEKRAGLAPTLKEEMAEDALLGLVPLGTTIATSSGERPEGHSRLKEWGGRTGGAILGGASGAGVGSLLGTIGMRLGSLGGQVGGEALASRMLKRRYYDEDGKLKKEFE